MIDRIFYLNKIYTKENGIGKKPSHIVFFSIGLKIMIMVIRNICFRGGKVLILIVGL